MTMSDAPVPAAMGDPAVLEAVEIGTTVSARVRAYTVRPSGVIDSSSGLPGTEIGVPALLVAVELGVTAVDVTLETFSRSSLEGRISMAARLRPTSTG
jgi:hypothetical protein